jgi:hypothetical protein
MNHYYENIEGWFSFPNLYTKMVYDSPENSHFVEVGTWLGKSATYMGVEIFNSNKKIKFDCVDTWKGSPEHQSNPEVINDTLYDSFLENIKPVKDIITPVRATSLSAATLYPDNSLDFVFIDANHDYENVTADILAWYPKVKSGGVLGGHDYMSVWPPVVQAVNDFLAKENYTLTIQSEDCWAIKKR